MSQKAGSISIILLTVTASAEMSSINLLESAISGLNETCVGDLQISRLDGDTTAESNEGNNYLL